MNNEKIFSLSPVFCMHNGAVVMGQTHNTVTIGLLNTKCDSLQKRLSRAVALQMRLENQEARAEFILVTKDEFNRRLSYLFGRTKRSNALEEENRIPENEATTLLYSLISTAVFQGASDIHIEENSVRFRIKGSLVKQFALLEEKRLSLVQKIKVLAHLNIAENRRAQDGSFAFLLEKNHRVFVRVSLLPALSAEKEGTKEALVLRLLDTERIHTNIADLGFSEDDVCVVKKLCTLKDGLVLICGPTGSGKSTTGAAMLCEIRRLYCDAKKIISLEDPPEYILDGVTQIQILEQQHFDFAEALKRTLRQDPDVLFIGEIRDEQTCNIAIKAALSGHFVIATLHTSSISQAVLRLCDLGANPSVANAVLRGIIVQHLDGGTLHANIRVLENEGVL